MLKKDDYEAHKAKAQSDRLKLLRAGKVKILSEYFNQADQVISEISAIPSRTLRSKDKLRNELAQISTSFEEYNNTNLEIILDAGAVISIGAAGEVSELVEQNDIEYSPSDEVITGALGQLQAPINNFQLSNAIWTNITMSEMMAYIIDAANRGLSIEEIVDYVSKYLKSSTLGNGYDLVERVINTELQRAYFFGNLNATREYNEMGGLKLLVEQYVSSAHSVIDICDDYAGVYDPAYPIPEIPRHPRCSDGQTTIFAVDYKGSVIKPKQNDQTIRYF